jgi:hypothetical protein
MRKELYKQIAQSFAAYLNCIKTKNADWEYNHYLTIEYLVKNFLPSGSGIDTGTKFDFDKSTEDKLVFYFSFHHMDENGSYCGWTDHKLILTPSLQFDFKIRITGPDRNGIKDYLHETFNHMLSGPVDYDKEKEKWTTAAA